MSIYKYLSQGDLQKIFVRAAGDGNLDQVKQLQQCEGVDLNEPISLVNSSSLSKPARNAAPVTSTAGNASANNRLYLSREDDGHSDTVIASGWTALMAASWNGRVEVVVHFVRQQQHHQSSSRNSRGSFKAPKQTLHWNARTVDGYTALHGAVAGTGSVKSDHVRIVKILLSQPGVNANPRDSWGNTALHYAAADGKLLIVQAFAHHYHTKQHVEWNATNEMGQSPLHEAVAGLHKEVVHFLLFGLPAGVVQPDIPDNFGDTPLHIATRRGNLEIVQLLLQQSAVGLYALNRFRRTVWDLIPPNFSNNNNPNVKYKEIYNTLVRHKNIKLPLTLLHVMQQLKEEQKLRIARTPALIFRKVLVIGDDYSEELAKWERVTNVLEIVAQWLKPLHPHQPLYEHFAPNKYQHHEWRVV